MISAMVRNAFIQRYILMCILLQYDLLGETDRKGDRDPKKRAAEIIAQLDVSGDKKLSKQEFIAGQEMFNFCICKTIFIFMLDVKMIQLFTAFLHQMHK